MEQNGTAPALALARKQRSHMLFVLSGARAGREPAFLEWYRGEYLSTIRAAPNVLRARQYEQQEVDVTRGRYARPPLHYLGLLELSLDGAEQAESLIKSIEVLHHEHVDAESPATWLYYPSSEKIGLATSAAPSMLTIAFANGVPGQEAEFREWYATRHIRHALNIPALVSGQCFERAQFQRPGAHAAGYVTIAVYEQESPPEAILQSFASLPEGTLNFPMLDRSRFTEACYRAV